MLFGGVPQLISAPAVYQLSRHGDKQLLRFAGAALSGAMPGAPFSAQCPATCRPGEATYAGHTDNRNVSKYDEYHDNRNYIACLKSGCNRARGHVKVRKVMKKLLVISSLT